MNNEEALLNTTEETETSEETTSPPKRRTPRIWTDDPMITGVADCEPDIVNSDLMWLKENHADINLSNITDTGKTVINDNVLVDNDNVLVDNDTIIKDDEGKLKASNVGNVRLQTYIRGESTYDSALQKWVWTVDHDFGHSHLITQWYDLEGHMLWGSPYQVTDTQIIIHSNKEIEAGTTVLVVLG
jgi:hypothetical protein